MNKTFINEIKKYARENYIPIINDQSLDYLIKLGNDKKIKNALEIGSAIGYSSLMLARSINSLKNIKTIEIDKDRYQKALQVINLEKDKIKIYNQDAQTFKTNELFDFIFIDAAKSKNKDFIIQFKNNLTKNGYIIIDNIYFSNLVFKNYEEIPKNKRSIVNRLKELDEFLEIQNDFKYQKINIGDGLLLLERK